MFQSAGLNDLFLNKQDISAFSDILSLSLSLPLSLPSLSLSLTRSHSHTHTHTHTQTHTQTHTHTNVHTHTHTYTNIKPPTWPHKTQAPVSGILLFFYPRLCIQYRHVSVCVC